MKSAFDYYDPETFFIKPVVRPEFVFPMPGGRFRGEEASAPDSVGRDGLPLLQTQDGLVIFGEYTKIKRLEWETPIIIRQSLISTARPDEKEGRYSFFRRTSFCLMQDYSQLSLGQSSPQPLVIRHELRMYDSPGAEWMAFNPELARAVGWTLDDETLFGWKDEKGQPMVWSIWWQDGLYQALPPKLYDDVGEGWAIVGSSKALEIITAQMGKQLTQYIRVEESQREEGQRKSSVKNAERLIDARALVW
jgi:hypothetical protein